MDTTTLIESFSYLAIFILMITNGIINLPSSQILYIVCGYFVSTGTLLFIPTIIAGALGNAIGDMITYTLVKKYDKPFARKIVALDEITFEKLHTALHTTFTRRGMWWIFFGKLIPSVKAFIPIVAGLAHTEKKITAILFTIASLIWALMIVSLGYFFGNMITPQLFTVVSLTIGLIVIYIVYKKFSHTFSSL